MKTTTHALAHGTSLLVALFLAGGCQSNTGLGNVDASGTAGVAGTMGSSPGSAGASLMGTAGTAAAGGAAGSTADSGTLGTPQGWTGYMENHMFPSGSDALVLTFATDAKGVVAGSIIFGMGTPPPPATDPNVGYPSNLLADGVTFGPELGVGYVAEGYTYAFDGGSFDGHRLRFAVNLAQLWTGWCALETPASDGSGSCLPNWGTMSNATLNMCAQFEPTTHQAIPVDCGKLFLCSGPTAVCACGAKTCGVSTEGLGGATFDVFITDGTGSGSATQTFWGTNNVHFVKN